MKYRSLARSDLSFGNVSQGKLVACVSFVELVSKGGGPVEPKTVFVPIHERFARMSALLRDGIGDVLMLNPAPRPRVDLPTGAAVGANIVHPSFRGRVGLASDGKEIVPVDLETRYSVMTFPVSGRSVASFVDMLGLADLVCGAPVPTPDSKFRYALDRSRDLDIETLHSIAQMADFFDVSFDAPVCSDPSPAGKTLTKLCAMMIGQRLQEGCAGVPTNGLVGYMKNAFSFLGIVE